MKLNPEFILREVAGEFLIVNPYTETVDTTNIYSLNESAALLWKELSGKDFTLQDMADLLLRDYEVEPQQALQDATELITQWTQAGFVA